MTTTSKNPLLIDIPMPITTPRLILRPAQAGDGAASHEAKRETIDQLKIWMTWADENETVEQSELVCREIHIRFLQRVDMTLFAFERDTGRLVAGTGLHRFDWNSRDFEIGYWVRASAQGQGYATEIANALTRYAFGALDANVVRINHADGNDNSARVISKLGYTLDGVIRRGSYMPDGSIRDHKTYSRIDMNGLPELDIQWGPT